jgi:ribosome-associated protein
MPEESKPFQMPPPAVSPRRPLPPDGGVEVGPGVRVAESSLRFQFARSSGPGGQNVNKVNTKAELWVPVTALHGLTDRALGRLRAMAGRRLTTADELHLVAEAERSQESNRAAVLDRLRELIVQARHEPKPRKKTKPSYGAKQRRLASKKRRSEIKAGRRGRPE